MKRSLSAWLLAAVYTWSAALAGEAPQGVSPGARSAATVIASSCPTFSWAHASSVSGYELVVYAIEEHGTGRHPLLRKQLPGSASSWTPDLADCLPPGGSYAWAVLALGAAKDDILSTPLFFRTPAAPTADELEHALGVLRRWEAGSGVVPTSAAVAGAPSADATRSSTGKAIAGSSVAVTGANTDSSGAAIGVLGSTAGSDDSSYAVLGHATASSGAAVGVAGRSDSASGAAGAFFAPGGGDILVGANASGDVFSVDNSGVVSGIGSGLTNVDASTLSGIAASSFAFTGHPHSGNDITSGTLAEARLDSAITRDNEVMPIVLANDEWVDIEGDTMTGDLSTDGNYRWTAARTFYADIPGNVLIDQSNWTHDDGKYIDRGDGYVQLCPAPAGPLAAVFTAPLGVPQGATMTEVTLYGYDNDATNDATFAVFAYRRAVESTAVTGITSASFGTTGASTTIQSVTQPIFDQPIDSKHYMYWLEFVIQLPGGCTGFLRLYGARITYTLDGPAS